jgi:NAD(P)-dependent dehydrogenase (short-subunit alcohol dehydrogenase family)
MHVVPDRIVEGKVVVVTGGGGGIGRAIAHLMAEQGAKVVVNDLGTAVDGSWQQPGLAEQVAQEIRAAGGAAVANADAWQPGRGLSAS